MKYKVGDKVRVKSLEWYNENKDNDSEVVYYNIFGIFTKYMVKYCGKETTILEICDEHTYRLYDCDDFLFSSDMFDPIEDETPVLEIPVGYEVDKIESGKIYLKKQKVTTYNTIPQHKGYNLYDTYKLEREVKSAIAMLKISQLMPYYGGTITNEEWNDKNIVKCCISCWGKNIESVYSKNCRYFLAFHTDEQRERFMSYPENVQLVKDYLMIA